MALMRIIVSTRFDWSPVLLSLVLVSTVLAFTVLLSGTLYYRAVPASASFILLLFIHWNFHLSDRQNRSLFFRVKCMPASFPGFLLLPILILPLTASSPSQPQQRHIKVQQDLQYTIERNWLAKKNS